MRLLAELDLLKDASKSDEEDSRSLDEVSVGDSASVCSFDVDAENIKERERNDEASFESASSASSEVPIRNSECAIRASISQKGNLNAHSKMFQVLFARLIIGVNRDGLGSHVVYAVTVVKFNGTKETDSWIVYRRYSDFYDFQARMEGKVIGN